MDFKQIQELIKMINKSNIGEVTVELKDFRVTIKQKEDRIQQVISAPVHTAPVCAANSSCACTYIPGGPAVQPTTSTESTKEAAVYSKQCYHCQEPDDRYILSQGRTR